MVLYGVVLLFVARLFLRTQVSLKKIGRLVQTQCCFRSMRRHPPPQKTQNNNNTHIHTHTPNPQTSKTTTKNTRRNNNTHARTHARTHACAHTRTHTHTHTHTHTIKPTVQGSSSFSSAPRVRTLVNQSRVEHVVRESMKGSVPYPPSGRRHRRPPGHRAGSSYDTIKGRNRRRFSNTLYTRGQRC